MHGSILHDASYYSLIEIKGAEKVLKLLLENCCDCQGPGPGAKRYVCEAAAGIFDLRLLTLLSPRFLTGARIAESYIYKAGSYPFDLIAPITVIWKPVERANVPVQPGPTASTEPAQGTNGTQAAAGAKKKRRNKKNKGKAPETQPIEVIQPTQLPSATQSSDEVRIVWIRSHPAVFEEVFSTLQNAASLALVSLKKAFPTEDVEKFEVEIADLRESINVFEIMGPKSNQVLKGALTPVGEDKREEFKKVNDVCSWLQSYLLIAVYTVLVVSNQPTDLRLTPSWYGHWLQSARSPTQVRSCQLTLMNSTTHPFP